MRVFSDYHSVGPCTSCRWFDLHEYYHAHQASVTPIGLVSSELMFPANPLAQVGTRDHSRP
jgi:hypothetical protein